MTSDARPARPNILLITTDQHRGDCLGVEHAAGAPHPVMTPHLDQVAYEGLRFSRAYSDCPVCIPARTTIMTGRCAYSHGITGNAQRPIPEEPARTLPGRLAAAGYQTHAAGKMHFYPPRRRNGFERMRLLPEDYVNWLERTPYPGGYRGHGLGGNEVYATFNPLPVQFTATHWIVTETIDFLRQRDPDHPFFLWTSFEAPHPPYEPPEAFVRLYDGVDIPPPVVGDWAASRDDVPHAVQQRRWTHKLDTLTAAQVQAARRHYYAQITHVDYELGRLFGELQSQKLWPETVVIFTSDHGEMLGDHSSFHKSFFYEPSARVPFLVRIPEHFNPPAPAGSVITTPVMLADLYPTCLDLAGLWTEADAAERDGQSLLRLEYLAADEATGDRGGDGAGRWLYGQCGSGRNAFYMATDGRWKYLYYVWGGTEQLFDLRADPGECVNRARDAVVAPTLAACRQRLGARFPGLLAGGHGADHPFRLVDDPLPDEARTRATNPFAWRGPIRYGGHW